jgi:hypothetical protein
MSLDRTEGENQKGQVNLDRSARTGYSEEDSLDRIFGTQEPGEVSLYCSARQEVSLDSSV